MPCADGGYSYSGPSESERRQIAAAARIEPLLCSACRVLTRLGFDFDENPELSDWWNKHKQADEAREREEIQKRLAEAEVKEISKKPFNKLTKEDKQKLKKFGYL